MPLALRARGIHLPYTHQSQAIAAALAGENVVVVTPTASGKTLCYNLPALHTLLDDPDARALYLFPTKALAQDQLVEVREMVELLQADITIASYDGDTLQGHRKAIRQGARLLLSNPDMLHTGVLPHHTNWAEFFRGLRLVVIDEMHTYRGVFGAHVANVLRRLRRICRFYGSDPTFILTSATIANPAEHARTLIEADVTLVDDNGAPAGEKHLIFYNPPLVDPDLGLRRSSLLEAQKLGERCLFHDVQAILFARSRLRVELLLVYLRDAVRAAGGDPAAIRGYRGGYLPAERREIESGLRSGQVRAVMATNALELGIDIGQLQAAVITGFPGTIASTWQQAGRAGRRQEASLAVFIAGAGALDQYIVQNPDYFFGRSPEHALINPDNLVILTNHLRCAAFELPFATGRAVWRRAVHRRDLLEMLAEEGEIQQAGERYFWMDSAYPAAEISLRTASPDPIVIMVEPDSPGSSQIDHRRNGTGDGPDPPARRRHLPARGPDLSGGGIGLGGGPCLRAAGRGRLLHRGRAVADLEVLAVHQQDQEGELITRLWRSGSALAGHQLSPGQALDARDPGLWRDRSARKRAGDHRLLAVLHRAAGGTAARPWPVAERSQRLRPQLAGAA